MKTTIDHKFNVGDTVFFTEDKKVRQGYIYAIKTEIRKDKLIGMYLIGKDFGQETRLWERKEREIFTSPTKARDFIIETLKKEIYDINKDYLQ